MKKKQPKLNRTQAARLRTAELRKLLPGGKLDEGDHGIENLVPQGVCLMEAVAWVAGEPHSDHPKCACPVLTELGIEINDSSSDGTRQDLIAAIPALIGSKTSSKRTRFKRVRRATELALHAVLQAIPDSYLRPGKADSTVERFVVNELLDIRGRTRLTKQLTKRALDALRHFDMTHGDDCDLDDYEEIIGLLETVYGMWDPNGISEVQYNNAFTRTSFTSVIPDSDLPSFFVDVATQHA